MEPCSAAQGLIVELSSIGASSGLAHYALLAYLSVNVSKLEQHQGDWESLSMIFPLTRERHQGYFLSRPPSKPLWQSLQRSLPTKKPKAGRSCLWNSAALKKDQDTCMHTTTVSLNQFTVLPTGLHSIVQSHSIYSSLQFQD